jgi:hypothetical protein
MDLMEPYAYGQCEEFEEKYLSGYEAQVYNMPAENLAYRAEKKAETYAKSWLQDSISGYSRLETAQDTKTQEQQKTEFALLPVWVYDYQYKDKHYLFYINGQSGKIVGKAPISKERMLALTAAVFGAAGLFVGGFLSLASGLLGVL